MFNKICKECGGRVINITLTCMPPINQEVCNKCGRVISSKRDEIIYEEV